MKTLTTNKSIFVSCWRTTDSSPRIWKLDKSTPNVFCFGYEFVISRNFYPLTDNLVFLGSRDNHPETDYNFIMTNLTSLDPVWVHSIKCPIGNWRQRWGYSTMSKNRAFLYTMINYNRRHFWYTFDSSNGEEVWGALERVDNGNIVYDIQEMLEFLVVLYRDNNQNF